jgi:hypothetical protein
MDDINYFLLLKDKYNSMLSNIDKLIETCEIINEYNEELNKKTELHIILLNSNKEFFEERKKEIQNLKNLCDQSIYSLCTHEFVRDNIDIDPDKSMTISYCRLCELNEVFK